MSNVREIVYSGLDVADWFVNRAVSDGRNLSIMSLLKLAYIAHGWRLEMTGRPLFDDIVEAWQYGPVIPKVYRAYRPQGISVSRTLGNFKSVKPADADFLEQIYKIYGAMDPFHLSDLTHVDGGPWDLATKAGGYYAPIPNEMIMQHYQARRRSSEATANNG